jgi:general secretion pathway protein A
MTRLNSYLLSINSAGQDAVVIIDEAQDMPDATLEMTRLLSNLETTTQKLLQIVLVGQPELRDKLAKPSLRQLAQRITVRYHLGQMDGQQTRQYVLHRMSVAAGEGAGLGPVRFDEDALDEIHRQSLGTPRWINAICDKSLLAGYVHQAEVIDGPLVRLAAGELKEAS